MKVLFLDVDGVLNSQRTFESLRGVYSPNRQLSALEWSPHVVDPCLIRRLALWYLWAQPNLSGPLRVVLSSTWRLGPAFNIIWSVLYSHGIPLFDETPVRRTPGDKQRGFEVRQWLSTRDVAHYAILDDATDFFDDQPLVHVDSEVGVTWENLREVARYLDVVVPEVEPRYP